MPWKMRLGMRSNTVCLDTSYLVGLFDKADRWHTRAREIDSLLLHYQVGVSFLDCVLNELFTVLARRCRERGSPEAFLSLLDQVAQAAQETPITWLYPHVPRWYSRCLGIMRGSQGQLNFHDALIVVAMQELGFSVLLSFDAGFDEVVSINRLGSTNEVALWLKERHP